MENVLTNRYYKNEMVKYEEQREREEFIKLYCDGLTDKDIGYRDFIFFILEQIEWKRDLIIIKGEEMEIVNSNKFYEEFEKITGIGIKEFEKCFVSGYIEEFGNSANLIVKVNGTSCRFIIDVV